ncbi:MAG: CocE/NonD family hydrolase [Pseudomonadota bacterium]
MADIRVLDPVWVPMPDGRRLAAKLWLPADPVPAPAILEYLPYRRRDGTAGRDATTHAGFAAQGYACVRIDIAGTGDSDGIFVDEYSEQELSDGEAALAWIAEQSWCNGRIGMIGISWGGFNGLQLAFRRPPALKAVVSCCSTVDRFADDIHYMGGCLLTDNFNWGAQMTAYQSRPPDPLIRDDWRARWLERIEHLPFLAADWLRRPARDAYWRQGSVCEDFSAIEAAVLGIGGWADAYVNAPIALAENLSGPRAALIGPWEHKYPHIARIEPADFHGEVLGWFDRWLKQRDAPPLPQFRAHVQEHAPPSTGYGPRAGTWVAEPDWPLPGVQSHRLALTKAGLRETPGRGTIAVASPQHTGTQSAYFCPGMRVSGELAADQAPDDARSACFDTEPLEAPMTLLGRAEAVLEVSADQPSAQLCLRLCDVAPDGQSVRITYRPIHLGHHAGAENPGPIEPGNRYRLSVLLNGCAHRLRAGHRLRLAISTAYWPVLWPSPKAASVRLHLDSCALDVPVRSTPVTPSDTAPGRPRTFPRLEQTVLRVPSARGGRHTDAAGHVVLETEDDFGLSRNLDHGLETGSHVLQRFSIHPDDPLSASHTAKWKFAFRRGSWAVQIDSQSRMTCSAEAFHLWRRVTAREGETVVLEKTWAEEIPRRWL